MDSPYPLAWIYSCSLQAFLSFEISSTRPTFTRIIYLFISSASLKPWINTTHAFKQTKGDEFYCKFTYKTQVQQHNLFSAGYFQGKIYQNKQEDMN